MGCGMHHQAATEGVTHQHQRALTGLLAVLLTPVGVPGAWMVIGIAFTVDATPPAAPVIAPTNGTLITGSGEPGAVVTVKDPANNVIGTATVAADGTWSTSVPTADLKQDADSRIEGSVTGTNGSAATAAQDYVVEAGNTATQTALSIDKVTADNIIGVSEATGPITVTGAVTAASFAE